MTILDSAELTRTYALDEAGRKDLATAWGIIEPKIGEILAAFYDRWERNPDLAKMIAGRRNHLLEHQGRHWAGLFSGRFDATYMESARRIGLTHLRIGLEPHWYISGYNDVLSRMVAIIGAKTRFSGPRAARLIRAVTSAVMVDLDIAISVYGDTYIARLADRQQRTDDAIRSFDGTMQGLLETMHRVSGTLGTTSTDLDRQANGARTRTETVSNEQRRAAEGLGASAAATEELYASIGEIGRQAAASQQVADRAVAGARRTSETVSSLAEAAERIGSVIQLISDIASQTNLLALNATIEAARAGDAGRGFAVVASEVKSLAGQTTKATEDITSQISTIQEATRRSVSAIGEITATIDEIARIGSAIAAAVEEQGAATREIAASVQNIAQSSSSIEGELAEVSRESGETVVAAGRVSHLAGDLHQQAESLERSLASFVKQVSAAA